MTDGKAQAVVVTGAPGAAAVTPRLVEEMLAALLPADGGEALQTRWLAPGDAFEVEVAESAFAGLEGWRAAAACVRGADVDVNALPVGIDRRKRLLVADMESTIIEQEMLDELADIIGQRPRVAAITERAMRGELDFEAALRERVGLLAGLDAGVLDAVAERITLMPGAAALVATMRANGARCVLVSGGFTVFTERVARRLGFDEHQANVLEIEDGKLTGRVREPILGREAKRAALERLAVRLGLGLEATLAVGDGANDLDMLGAAGLGVAFRAKPKVREAAAALANGAVITHGDLTALLHLQGYRRADFAS